MAPSLFIHNAAGRQTLGGLVRSLVLCAWRAQSFYILFIVTIRHPAVAVIAAKTLHVRYCNICITFFVLSKKRLVILQIISVCLRLGRFL